jgi:hypothetical protein
MFERVFSNLDDTLRQEQRCSTELDYDVGNIAHKHAATGDDLVNFVNHKLWPYLKGFHDRASSANTIEYKIGEIFNEISCKFASGWEFRPEFLVESAFQRGHRDRRPLLPSRWKPPAHITGIFLAT